MLFRTVEIFWDIQVRDQIDAQPVIEGDLLVDQLVALRKRLVPGELVCRACNVGCGRSHAQCHAGDNL